LIDDINTAAKLHVQDAIAKSSKGLLLRGRMHSHGNRATVAEPIAFRLYLTATTPGHRKALASLLLADPPRRGAATRMSP
ncbi:hypothetical protein FIBSPDRAFT_761520, partial [Athelia psychrophila]